MTYEELLEKARTISAEESNRLPVEDLKRLADATTGKRIDDYIDALDREVRAIHGWPYTPHQSDEGLGWLENDEDESIDDDPLIDDEE